uniref:Fungal lipase-type domain-containing protein n=1 Tax=Davidia involucrata TaxID=16924 RepID=A0A5B7B6R4_DAVIN
MDSLCLKAGIHGMTSPISVAGVGLDVRTNPSHVTAAVGRSTSVANGISVEKPTVSSSAPPQRTAPWGFSFKYPLRSLWPGGGKRYDAIAADDAVLVEENEQEKGGVIGGEEGESGEEQNGSWILKIRRVKSLWREEGKDGIEELGEKAEEENGVVNDQNCECSSGGGNDDGDEECDVCRVDDDEDKIEFDRDSFSKLLRRVSLAEARLYAQMSYLGNLAYSIPQIKPGNLLKYHGLRFVTSSLEKKELTMKAEKEKVPAEVQEAEGTSKELEQQGKDLKNNGNRISASAAYQIAASAASYLHSHTKSILPFKSSKSLTSEDQGSGISDNVDLMNNDMASFMATTDSVTAVVAAKEEVKQAVADDLSSTRSSPCEWFICDDDQSGTRFFVIQGSESVASWQANLLFEPIQFEGLDVLVHRGIYEAAKGIYEQMLPEVRVHLKSHGDRAIFRFTGHSLGGSLSLLVNLIVPRAFSCNYPNHVSELLKAVNGNFRNHPCLNNQRLLYAPMGEFLILQPDEKFSPSHHLMPSGSGLYLLNCSIPEASEAEKQLRAAQGVFLNSPHPLEILRDRSAYGSDGTIQRDHDMKSYLKSVRSVIRQELNRIRKARREHQRKVWWSGINATVIVGRSMASANTGQNQFNFSGILQTGRESLKRFSRLITSQHTHLLVVLLFPARLFLLGAYSIISY